MENKRTTHDALFEGAKCKDCGKLISVVLRFEGGLHFEEQNLQSRFIDQFGYARNFCKECIAK